MLEISLMKKIKDIKIVILLILYTFFINQLLAATNGVTSTANCQQDKNIFATAKCILKLPIADTGLSDDTEEDKRELILKMKIALDEKASSNENLADATQAIYLLYNDLYLIHEKNFDGMDSLKYIKKTVDLDPHRLVPLVDLLAAVLGTTEHFLGGIATLRAGIDREKTFYFLVTQLSNLNQLTSPQIKQDLIKLAEELDIDAESYCLP